MALFLSKKISRFLVVMAAVVLTACSAPKTPKTSMDHHAGATFTGLSSWYGRAFNGRRTASGERFNMHKLTAAHKTLPFGTVLEVTNLANDKTVLVTVNDRGPFVKNRVLDLSYGAAKVLGFAGAGTAQVRARVVE